MKRTIHKSALLAATAAAVLIAACGAPGTSGTAKTGKSQDLASPATKSGTLSIITKFADPKYAPFFVDVAKAYESANPGVKVNLQQVGDQPYKDKIRVLSASKSLPDIYFSWAGDFANKFIRGGLATDLTSVVGPSSSWGKTFSPAALKAFEYQGKNYGVPIDLDAKYMVYNKVAFQKAGLSGPPTSLADLLSDCGKLKAAGYTPIAFGNQFGWPAIHYLTQLNTFDVPAATLAKDYNPSTGEFTDPGYVKALEQFQSIVKECSNPSANGLSHEAAQATFLNGKAAMHYLELLEFPAITTKGGATKEVANNWDFFRLPAASDAPGDKNALTGAPDGFMVNQGSKNAALAVDFLKFMTNLQNAQKMTKQIGYPSPVQGSATEANSVPQQRKALEDMASASAYAIWLDTVTNADVANAFLAGAEGIANGSQTPQQVIQAVQKAAAKVKKQS
ncbi:ABC transporter substrate-binding protein [Pedococcus sp. 5OH_020]|uniref:ABC transporter substrate-binding protein n=1 Tax=Pedococcus sp. 5OH_020 TaxID=2989814 RepID=UPI0022E9F61D|nr:extracellular solute-binding protein [Pedococcus sp. 5OH_020]